MSRRELKISDKALYPDTKEDLILSSPPRIPDRDVSKLLRLRTIQGTNIAYYDIAPTEEQAISRNNMISIIPFGSSALDPGEGETKMGEINDI